MWAASIILVKNFCRCSENQLEFGVGLKIGILNDLINQMGLQ
jgi:hypothetical protein